MMTETVRLFTGPSDPLTRVQSMPAVPTLPKTSAKLFLQNGGDLRLKSYSVGKLRSLQVGYTPEPLMVKRQETSTTKELVHHPLFPWYLAYSATSFSSIYTPGIFIVPFGVKYAGLTQATASSMLSVYAVFILIGSLGTGLILSIPCMRPRKTQFLLFGMIMLGITSMFLSLAKTHTMLVLLVAIFGIFYGVWGATYFTVMVHLFGERLLPTIASICQLFGSVTIFGGPPLAGIVSSYFDWYGLVFVFAGGLILLSCIFLCQVVRKEKTLLGI